MEATTKPPSKLRIILMWLLMLGMILFWVVFWICNSRGHAPAADESAPKAVRSIFSLFIGGFFLVAGVLAYVVAVFSGCFSFSFRQPIWQGVKVRLFIVNIITTVLLGLGFGFVLSAFTSPVLIPLGLDAGLANMLPLMLVIGGIQMLQLWVLIWAPMERRLILNRLVALGVQPAQLQNAVLVGLSNPASGFATRFGTIEEDMGALWVGPEQLIYRGDGEQFGILRGQIVQIERKADNRSTTVLGGIQHVILHARLPDGGVRQIRLHTEGLWTMGQKRRVMDALAEAIARWHAGTS